MNKLSTTQRTQIVSVFMEGVGINSATRITGISKPTILKLLADLGKACTKYQDKHLRNLPCKRIQADEVWSFCYAKDKNLPKELQDKFGFGSTWTWTALCPDSKLIVSWLVGGRDADYASKFMNDLAGRQAGFS